MQALRDTVLEHHMKQHRQAMAESRAKHKGSAPVYCITIVGATNAGDKVTSNGKGMFQGPIDTASERGRQACRAMLGKSFMEFELKLSQVAPDSVLLITNININDMNYIGFLEETV